MTVMASNVEGGKAKSPKAKSGKAKKRASTETADQTKAKVPKVEAKKKQKQKENEEIKPKTEKSPKAKILGECLNKAVGRILNNRKSPSRVVNQIDNRATNYYVSLYWADYLQQEDPAYKPIFEALSQNRSKIVEEFSQCQGNPVDLGGYYLFDSKKATEAMNPSPTLNKILESCKPKFTALRLANQIRPLSQSEVNYRISQLLIKNQQKYSTYA